MPCRDAVPPSDVILVMPALEPLALCERSIKRYFVFGRFPHPRRVRTTEGRADPRFAQMDRHAGLGELDNGKSSSGVAVSRRRDSVRPAGGQLHKFVRSPSIGTQSRSIGFGGSMPLYDETPLSRGRPGLERVSRFPLRSCAWVAAARWAHRRHSLARGLFARGGCRTL